MPKTYSVATDLTLHHVVDGSVKVVLLPTVFLRESFGVTVTTAVGNADGVASVNGTSGLFVGVSGTGNADGAASVSGVSKELVGAVGNADGVASAAAHSPIIDIGVGHADGIADVFGFNPEAFVVANADGIADVEGISQYVVAVPANADGRSTALGGVKIPGDGCALLAGI